jgi:hypothetical protein
MSNFPQQASLDPVIVPLPQCPKCGGHLADLHVHEGTTSPASRGKIVQLVSFLFFIDPVYKCTKLVTVQFLP